MTLSGGSRLGPYEILAPVGAGGMGEVYRARDTRLDRTVAIKVLPSHLSNNAEFRQRFEREAKTISSLSHPHICALYDVGHQDGTDYLVMEFLEGETLSDRLARGALPLEQTLRYGVEIADALDKAHRQGIVHRDLKPGNVMLTKSGVKLLDFGLAKGLPSPSGRGGGDEGLTSLPTQANLTQEGTILGTFQYMAPEQLEGREADARTDIFALGTVLYEMATGKKAFSGTSQASLISAIMKEEPAPLSSIQPPAPPALDRVVRTCLAKDPEDRWQTAHDVKLQLHWIREGGSQAGVLAPMVSRRRNRERIAWCLAGFFALLAVLPVVTNRSRRTEPRTSMRASILPPPGTSFDPIDGPVVVSPNGRRIAFSARDPDGENFLWVRSLDSLQAQKLEGTGDAYDPFWSPDGRFVAFGQAALKKIEVSGGPPQKIAEMVDGRGGTWNRDNVILFAKTGASPLFRVLAAGGAPQQVTTLDKSRQEIGHWRPQFLPDGRRFLYLARSREPQNSGIYAGSLDSKETKRVADLDVPAYFAQPGYLLFVRDGVLMAQSFDSRRLRVSGDSFPVARDVQYVPTWGSAAFWASDSGVLAYQGVSRAARRLVWYDRQGREIAVLASDAEYRQEPPRISPDATRVAVTRLDPETRGADVWVLSVSRGIGSRLTFETFREAEPVWSADGKRIFYTSNREGVANIYARASSGSGAEELLLQTDLWKETLDASPDGAYLLYRVEDPKTRDDLWLLPLSDTRKPTPFLATSFRERDGRFSPDGRWIAYVSDETGKDELFVQPFPPTGEKWQVSSSGGKNPRWARNGRELFYFEPPDRRKVVEIRTGPAFEASLPKDLFRSPAGWDSDVAADGQRILFNVPAAEVTATPMTLVLDWAAGLKQ